MRVVESYRFLQDVVGRSGARQIVRGELVHRVAARLRGPGWSAVTAPSFDEIVNIAPVTTSVDDVLDWLGVSEDYSAEFLEVDEHLLQAYAKASLTCPPEWAIEESTSRILYALVRHMRPKSMVETGIANGHSSFVILSAMARNGTGHLVSVDVQEETGRLVPAELYAYWDRIIIPDRRPSLSFLLDQLEVHAPFDIFFHDGDHRFIGQMIDYSVAMHGLAAHGVLISDDINTTGAWVYSVRSSTIPENHLTLLDQRKAVGFAKGSGSKFSGLPGSPK